MTKIFFGGFLFLLLLTGCRTRYGIQKSYAFSRKMTAGTVAVDHNNRSLAKGVQTAHLIYVETKAGGSQPVWDTAWINSVPYLIKPLKITQDKVTVGRPEAGGEEIILQPTAGGTLWQLMLKPVTPPQNDLSDGEKIPVEGILLTGSWKSKRASYAIKNQTELAKIFGE